MLTKLRIHEWDLKKADGKRAEYEQANMKAECYKDE